MQPENHQVCLVCLVLVEKLRFLSLPFVSLPMITLKPHVSPGPGPWQLHDALAADAQGAVGHLATGLRQLHGQVDHHVALPPRGRAAARHVGHGGWPPPVAAATAAALGVLVARLQADAAAQRLEATAQEEVLQILHKRNTQTTHKHRDETQKATKTFWN